jgi:hypothetical protein
MFPLGSFKLPHLREPCNYVSGQQTEKAFSLVDDFDQACLTESALRDRNQQADRWRELGGTKLSRMV